MFEVHVFSHEGIVIAKFAHASNADAYPRMCDLRALGRAGLIARVWNCVTKQYC